MGSRMDLSMISRPEESLGRGSCCAEIIFINERHDKRKCYGSGIPRRNRYDVRIIP